MMSYRFIATRSMVSCVCQLSHKTVMVLYQTVSTHRPNANPNQSNWHEEDPQIKCFDILNPLLCYEKVDKHTTPVSCSVKLWRMTTMTSEASTYPEADDAGWSSVTDRSHLHTPRVLKMAEQSTISRNSLQNNNHDDWTVMMDVNMVFLKQMT